jgi:hypothetical protein
VEKENLLKKVNEILENEGELIENNSKNSLDAIEENIIPAMANAKNTLASLYKYAPKDKKGLIGKLKNGILGRLKNITLNVVERQSMQQQKFNELTYNAIELLLKENKELREKLEDKANE